MTFKALVGFAVVGTALGSTGCSRDVETVKREYVARADRYMQDGNVDAAIIEYRNALQRDPRFGEAYRKLAAAYLKHNDGPNAVRAAVTAAELLPTDLDAQIDAGTLLLFANKFAEARAVADKVLAVSPNEVRGRVLLGYAIAGMKDIDAAIKEFEEALRLDPQQAGIYTGLATLKATSGDRIAAERIFQQALSTDTKSIPARLALAHFYWANDRVGDAEGAMKDALAIDSRNSRANMSLALFYQATNRRAEAEPFLRTAAQASGDPQLVLVLADYYIGLNRGSEAAELLQPLASHPRFHVPVRLRLAGIAHATGRLQEALNIIDEAVTADPKNARTLAAKSDLLLRQNRIQEAAATAEAAVAANVSSAEAQFVRGRVLSDQGRYDKAEEAFNEVLRINPRAAAVRVELARLRIRQGSADAVAVATEAAAAEPRSLYAQLTLARAMMANSDLAAARTMLTKMVEAAPTVAAVHAQLGTAYALAKDVAAARASFTRALELDPVNLEAARGLTSLDFAGGQHQAALDRLDAMLVKAPRDARLMTYAATAHASASGGARAESLLRAAIEISPDLIAAYTALGRLYVSQNRLDEAGGQFEKLASRQDRPVAALTMVGMIHMMRNRSSEAQRTFERVLQLDPKAGVAANNLAWLYLENGGSVDMAVRLANVAKAVLPEAAEVDDTLGWAYYRKDMMPQALAALRRSAERNPQNTTTLYHLALAHSKNGDHAEARRVMAAYLQLDPDSDRSAEVRKRLQALGV